VRPPEYAEADRWFTEGVAYCDEHDVTTFSSCLRGERTWTLTMTRAGGTTPRR
jgi:hypothetical protein